MNTPSEKSLNTDKILFVCEDNSGPSQMARAFAEKYGIRAFCAGRHSSSSLNHFVVAAMKELEIDISAERPKSLSPQIINDATLVITLGCPFLDALPQPMVARMREKTINWSWKGMKCKRLIEARETRDEIKRRVIELAKRQPNTIVLEAV